MVLEVTNKCALNSVDAGKLCLLIAHFQGGFLGFLKSFLSNYMYVEERMRSYFAAIVNLRIQVLRKIHN